MRIVLAVLILLSSCGVALSQHAHDAPESNAAATLMSGLGDLHHEVSTNSEGAQRFFDQGLALVYAFNYPDARRSFQHAAELDPRMAMAYWGLALAGGPNINQDIDAEGEKEPFEAVQKALALSGNASESEQLYIKALAKRYSTEPQADLKQLAIDYKDAMGAVAKLLPDDPDAATLYAESLMNLRSWKLWTVDGKPAEGTEEIMSVLESVLRRHPNHLGANHYYIHAVEASPHPEWGLPSAERLRAMNLSAAAAHLVHMPSHIYLRIGDYEAAAQSNEAALALHPGNQASSGHARHCLNFLVTAYSMQGRFSAASAATAQLESLVSPSLRKRAGAGAVVSASVWLLVRFRRWDDILKSTEPHRGLLDTNTFWRWARAMAYAWKGKPAEAEAERALFIKQVNTIPADAVIGLNSEREVFQIADYVLSARIAHAKGDRKAALDALRKAVESEDALVYSEPPDWCMPARETLGGLLLLYGDYVEAEKIFRADLLRNPRNGRSLFGLVKSLEGQGKNHDASLVRLEFESAWGGADTQLKVEEL
jgi:tetratricopeptide (TPR) repeat protein